MNFLIRQNFVLLIIAFTWRATEGFLTDMFFRNMISFQENALCGQPSNNTKFAIVVHGWKETCETSWVTTLKRKLKRHRGGCIMCMDYRFFSQWPNYFFLIKYTSDIAKILENKLNDLEEMGFDPDNGYMFGFSLGARIILEAGREYGEQKIAEIDTCDMAGPGFDKHPQPDPKESAQNVQCISTSKDKGSKLHNCHQNWLMGYCGAFQPATKALVQTSHGMCPIFYNSAFENDFYAETHPQQCNVGKLKRYWPKKFKMGYMERRKPGITGTFYSSTTKTYPYSMHSNKITTTNNEIVFMFDGQKYYIT